MTTESAPIPKTAVLSPPKGKFKPHPEPGPLPEADRVNLRARLEGVLAKLPPESDPELENLPRRALEFAIEAHGDQRRLSGKYFITHPMSVAETLVELVPDRATLAATLLHDVVEDTRVRAEDIRARFGDEVGFLVEGVTKVSRIRFGLQHEKQVENLRRLLVATAKDLRVIVIKLCDRLHNLKTLDPLPADKRRRICQTTLDIFAPIAHRLGLQKIKNQLEDHCLHHLHPSIYQDIKSKVDLRLAERHEYAEKVKILMADVLATHGIEADVSWRVKHFWSIYLKMQRDNKDFSEVYDLTGIRVLVDTVDQCYATLGIVHGVWPQVEGRFKDYISQPKQNDYRSIHTTVHGPDSRLLEIQIRTPQMHRVCEEGVAAHWRYKERGRSSRRLGDDADWIRQLSGLLVENQDQDEFSTSLKTELFADETYCYTPKGDIVRLSAGSTPIDFAYQIHTDLGDRCAGARVNNRFVPLSYELRTGDVVEIETSKNARPTADWLTIVKGSRARAKIRSHLLKSNRNLLIEQGQTLLSRELHRIGKNPNVFYHSELCGKILNSLEADSLDDLFAFIGFGRVATKQVISRILQSAAREKKKEKRTAPPPQQVDLAEDMLYRLARCCHPVHGETIVGLVTKQRGISIHRDDCVNIRNFRGDRARLLPLQWEGLRDGSKEAVVQLALEAIDRKQLLADVTNVIASAGIDIRKSQSGNVGKGRANLLFEISVRDIKELRRLASNLIEVKGVLNVSEKRGSRKHPLA